MEYLSNYIIPIATFGTLIAALAAFLTSIVSSKRIKEQLYIDKLTREEEIKNRQLKIISEKIELLKIGEALPTSLAQQEKGDVRGIASLFANLREIIALMKKAVEMDTVIDPSIFSRDLEKIKAIRAKQIQLNEQLMSQYNYLENFIRDIYLLRAAASRER